MAISFNHVTLIGRLCADPELQQTTDGTAVVKFSLAVDRFGKDSPCDYIYCRAFKKQAESIAKYMRKGSELLVSGRLQTYKGKDDRTYYEVLVNEAQFGSGKPTNGTTPYTPPPKKSTIPLDEIIHDATADMLDSDLPF